MPRFLPRLIKRLTEQPLSELVYSGKNIKRTRKRVSFYRPIPTNSSFDQGRPQSILLAKENPITNSRSYEPHKRLPPRVHLARRRTGGHPDAPRAMTDEERQWWSSPYLRMLASPVRHCNYTRRHLPSAFLLRFGIARLSPNLQGKPAKGMNCQLVPDGLEHPKFRRKRAGRVVYLLCWRRMLELAVEYGPPVYPRGLIHPNTFDHIGHLLRVRVLQELELLAEQMEKRVHKSAHHSITVDDERHLPPILRRLTRDEFQSVRDTGVIPYENAIAVLVVPPVNRDPETKEKPQGSMSTLPITEKVTKRKRPDLPITTLHSSSSKSLSTSEAPLADNRIPLYNGASMFPLRAQRAALHSLLTRILAVERQARTAVSTGKRAEAVEGDKKASHAFVLFSDGASLLRGDSAAVAIALWRVRIFENFDWEDDNSDGWLLQKKYLSVDKYWQ
ncbi:hypothetical protein BDZ89DRAFT_5882 [Hymenopellis radicata]|nr:hypothetical protein BDZ89DRAFT_5882 [Hymenopellis radicata]